MKLKELVAVIDESEQLSVKMNISRNKKEWGEARYKLDGHGSYGNTD